MKAIKQIMVVLINIISAPILGNATLKDKVYLYNKCNWFRPAIAFWVSILTNWYFYYLILINISINWISLLLAFTFLFEYYYRIKCTIVEVEPRNKQELYLYKRLGPHEVPSDYYAGNIFGWVVSLLIKVIRKLQPGKNRDVFRGIILVIGLSFVSLVATIALFLDFRLGSVYDFLKSKSLFLLVGLVIIIISFSIFLYYDKSVWRGLSSIFLKIKYCIISYLYCLTKYIN